MADDILAKLLADAGMTLDEFSEHMAGLEEIFKLANQFLMSYIQRVNDLGTTPPAFGILAMYQLARFQVMGNIQEGHIGRNEVRASKMAMQMLREMRHPDGKYPRMEINEDGNFERNGVHEIKP